MFICNLQAQWHLSGFISTHLDVVSTSLLMCLLSTVYKLIYPLNLIKTMDPMGNYFVN